MTCEWLKAYIGAIVVCDLDEFYIVIGTLAEPSSGLNISAASTRTAASI